MIVKALAVPRLMSLEDQERIYMNVTGDRDDLCGYWQRFSRWAEDHPRSTLSREGSDGEATEASGWTSEYP